MFDMHYDLLTLLYTLKNNKKYLNQIKKQTKKFKGITANLYFMNKQEMKKELNITQINVLEMFIESKKLLKKQHIKPKILYSIEGCDYIENTNTLEQLKKEGLNAILLVWNNPNKYGSGTNTNKGLTKDGEKFIQKAIDLNLGIDLSHTNKKTFNDIVNIIKSSNKKVVVYASHSNIYNLKKHPRNLTNNQLKQLKEINGKLGIVAYPDFVSENNKKQEYLKHIIYATKILGVENVMLSTDNMEFYNQINPNQNKQSIFNQKTINKEIRQLLRTHFNKKETKQIMYKNAKTIYKTLKNT